MPRDNQNPSQADAERLKDAHCRFLETRREVSRASEAEGKARRDLYNARRKRDAHRIHVTRLRTLAENRQLPRNSSTLREAQSLYFRKLDDFFRLERYFQAAEWNLQTGTMHFMVAKRRCAELNCPASHDEKHNEQEFMSEKENHRRERLERQRGEQTQQEQRSRSGEAKGHKRTYEQSTRNNPDANPKNSNDKYEMSPSEWSSTVQETLLDYASITEFPEPSARGCDNVVCISTAGSRVLTACPCNIREVLKGISKEELKKLRLGFHPDKFAKCAESVREEFKRKLRRSSLLSTRRTVSVKVEQGVGAR